MSATSAIVILSVCSAVFGFGLGLIWSALRDREAETMPALPLEVPPVPRPLPPAPETRSPFAPKGSARERLRTEIAKSKVAKAEPELTPPSTIVRPPAVIWGK